MTKLQNIKSNKHIPVLMREILELIRPRLGENYLDLTAGRGGHAQAITDITKNLHESVLVDRDIDAIEYLRSNFSPEVRLLHDNFLTASQIMMNEGKKFDIILADLGVSSPQFDNPDRGFSFNNPGPLDMRMDQSTGLSAYQFLNTEDESVIERMIKLYGEEPKAKKISRFIVQARPLSTTEDLSRAVIDALGEFYGKKSLPRVFQAIRIVVNDELRLLENSLNIWMDLLKPNGRLAVISFHSLEDRVIKKFFREYADSTYDAPLMVINKRPVIAKKDELVLNPRSRSAKLRVVVKK